MPAAQAGGQRGGNPTVKSAFPPRHEGSLHQDSRERDAARSWAPIGTVSLLREGRKSLLAAKMLDLCCLGGHTFLGSTPHEFSSLKTSQFLPEKQGCISYSKSFQGRSVQSQEHLTCFMAEPNSATSVSTEPPHPPIVAAGVVLCLAGVF